METVASRRSWRGTRILAATPLLALALIAAAALVVELVARSSLIRARLIPPSRGTPFRLLDQHLAQIDELGRSGVALDCIVVGNSLPLVGIDPAVMREASAERMGKALNCYNLGVPGIRAAGAAVLGRALHEDYGPWLFIYATSSREFSLPVDEPRLETIPWLRYRAGEPVFEGWLIDHSQAYRYYLLYRAWSDLDRRRFVEYRFPLSPMGFLQTHTSPAALEEARSKLQGAIMDEIGKGVSEGAIDGLRQLIALHHAEFQVVILEMPATPAFVRSLHEIPNHESIIDRLKTETERGGVPFWQLTDPSVLPTDGWADVWHLNPSGADSFSRWLAARITDGLAAGEIVRPPA